MLVKIWKIKCRTAFDYMNTSNLSVQTHFPDKFNLLYQFMHICTSFWVHGLFTWPQGKTNI